MTKTYNAKPGEIERLWYVVDAEGKTLGRLATQIADTLRGKRATYTKRRVFAESPERAVISPLAHARCYYETKPAR